MSVNDDTQTADHAVCSKKWAGTAASILIGLTAIAAAFVPAATPLVNSPAATATATAWVPLPIFGPKPVPHPRSAVGATQKPASSPSNAGAPAADWGTRATKPFQSAASALNSLGTALNNSDVNGMQAACRQLSSAGAQLGATLPSPNQQVTAEAQAAVDEISAMSGACLSDSPDVSAVASHASAANTHLANMASLASGNNG